MEKRQLLTCILGDRKGLGHGVIDPTFQINQVKQGNFPYIDDDEYKDDDVDVNDESFDAISKKTFSPMVIDPKASDTQYFVGATSKLHACFYRYNDILKEIDKLGKEIKIKEISVGGSDSSKAFDTGSYKRTGTTRGWASPPPKSKIDAQDEELEDEIYNLKKISIVQRQALGEYFNFERYI